MTSHLVHLKIALLRWKLKDKDKILNLFDRADKAGLVEHIEIKPCPLLKVV